MSMCHPSRIARMLSLLACVAMTSCLEFGEKVDLAAPQITSTHLKQIESLSGIELPAGTTGLAYHYDGSGIDPSFEAKLRIPADKVDPFLKSKALEGRVTETPTTVSGTHHQSWWKPDNLSLIAQGERKDQNPYVGYFFGKEGSDHVLYIQWITF